MHFLKFNHSITCNYVPFNTSCYMYYCFYFMLPSFREKALKNAKRAPVLMTSLGIERSVGVPKEHFPNVYDSLATAQMSSSFIAGTKVCQTCQVSSPLMS